MVQSICDTRIDDVNRTCVLPQHVARSAILHDELIGQSGSRRSRLPQHLHSVGLTARVSGEGRISELQTG